MIARANSEDCAISLIPDGSKTWERITEIQEHIKAERLDVAIALIGKMQEERDRERIEPHETTDVQIDLMGLPTGVLGALIDGGLRTLDDLLAHSDADLLAFDGIDNDAISAIRERQGLWLARILQAHCHA